jgi:hypothetical protein
MMLAADPPAVTVTAPVARPADVVVVSHESHSDVLVGRDTPLPLVCGEAVGVGAPLGRPGCPGPRMAD